MNMHCVVIESTCQLIIIIITIIIIIIIIIIITTHLTRVNPSAEAVINWCPGQLKN